MMACGRASGEEREGRGRGRGGVVTMNCGYCNTVKVSRELLIQQRNSLGNGLYLGGIWSLL